MRREITFALVAIAAGAAVAIAPAEAAKVCKEVVTAKARSAAQLSDSSRERRARDSAIANWGRRARDTYGWKYSFWRRAEEKNIECGGGATAKHCTVTAKPCSLF
jgi:hypothetical protein